MRDMTQQQYDAALLRHGFQREGFMGYYKLPGGLHASVWNAGPGASRRAKLAYLISVHERNQKEQEQRERNL